MINESMNKLNITKEKQNEIQQIWEVNSQAFETNSEADLVNRLRDCGVDFISLVAKQENEIVGHILFTEATLENSDVKIAGLAPMAVKPEFQNSRIGSALINHGLEECKSNGYSAVIVLGHPNYYPKFGFVPSVKFGIKSEYNVPDEVFMIKELIPNSLKDLNGIVKYHDEFNKL